MNEAEALAALLASKNGREICPDTIRRVFLAQRQKYRTVKEADKATRSTLHAITGAYLTAAETTKAEKMLRTAPADALPALLQAHASTRERLAIANALYQRAFALTGTPRSILDLACGLNPLYLGAKGYPVTGIDIHGGCVRLINECARALSLPIQAVCADILVHPPDTQADVALLMKLLPVLETEKPGSAMALLRSIHAPQKIITFPTRTLSGRGVGMEKHYSDWFESALTGHAIRARFVLENELVYVVKEDS